MGEGKHISLLGKEMIRVVIEGQNLNEKNNEEKK